MRHTRVLTSWWLSPLSNDHGDDNGNHNQTAETETSRGLLTRLEIAVVCPSQTLHDALGPPLSI